MILGRVCGLSLLLLAGLATSRGGELAPPFGLSWGGAPGRLVDWAKRFELDLLVKAPGKEPDVSILLITPETGSLPDHEASMLEARFIGGKLFEVGVHYTYPGQRSEFVQGRSVEMKRLLTVTHGEFKLSGRQKDVKDGITTTSEAYHLEPEPGYLLMLARTVVTDTKRGDTATRFSVVYHSDRVLRAERDRASATREGPEPIRLPERK